MRKQNIGQLSTKPKAQSAVEYPMTYGWAILIIAIIVAAFFALGLFNGGTGSPSSCVATLTYTCINPRYTSNGISATIGQSTGKYYYGTWVFVASNNETIGAFGLPQSFSTSSTSNMVSLGLLAPGETTSFIFSNTLAGQIPTDAAVGATFDGFIWFGYCTTPGCTSPTYYAKVASIAVQNSGTSSFGSSSGPSGSSVSNTVFTENGLPSGTVWYATYNGVLNSAISPSNIIFNGVSGSSAYSINSPIAGSSACYAAGTSSGSASGGSNVPITFTTTPCDVPISLTNSQSSTTSTGFQQMITISTNYAAYGEDTNLQNVEFTTGASGSGTALQAWCESGCTSGSGDQVWWVNLGSNTIAASGGTLTIYMDFMGSGEMSTSGPTGEAPQLYGGSYAQTSYAEYDNGPSVFPSYYQRWGQLSSLPSGWTNSGTGGMSISYSSTYITLTGGAEWGDIYLSAPSSTTSVGYTTDSYVTWEGNNMQFGVMSSTNPNNPNPDTFAFWSIYPTPSEDMFVSNNAHTALTPTFANPSVMSFTYLTTTTGAVYSNYSAMSQNPVTVSTSQAGTYLFFAAGYPTAPDTLSFYWTRTRVSPPNGVMPSVSFGAVV